MALSDMRNTNAIQSTGSEIAQIAELDTQDAIIAYYSLPVLESTELTDETATESITSEGANVYERDGARTVSMTMTMLQKDVNTLNLGLETKGKFFALVKEMNQEAVDGKHTYLCAPKVKFNPTRSFSNPGTSVQYTLNIENNTSEKTMDLTAFTDPDFQVTLSESSLTIPKNQRYAYYSQDAV